MNNLSRQIRQILIKICKRHEKRGSLTGVMKLGQDPAEEDRRAIENFFGLTPLINTSKQEIKLSFDRLLSGKNEEEITDWLKNIYQQTGRIPPGPVSLPDDAVSLLLDQLKLTFPRLNPVHSFLNQHKEQLSRKLCKQPAKIREQYFTAGKIVDFLLENDKEITLSELGAEFCASSKSLRRGEMKNMIELWLRLLRVDLPPEQGIWEEFMVIRDRLTITALIFAPLIYRKNGREYDWINQLHQAGEPAQVNWFHLDGMTSCRLVAEKKSKTSLITCENEAPFSRLLRESNDKILLFTSGFPNRAVCKLYQFLAPLSANCRHWGDSDPAGLRIAAILNAIHPLNLWRCDIATLRRHKTKLLPLTENQVNAASLILNSYQDFPFAEELNFTLKHGWLEQESRLKVFSSPAE